jgi:hypothetical protein
MSTNALNGMYGHLVIDGVNAWPDLGFIVLRKSMNSWLLFPERKAPFTHDWRDEDGIEIDLEHVYLKEKKVSLIALFAADSEVQFWNNYREALELMAAPGIQTVYYRELDKDFGVYYTGASNPVSYGRLKGMDVVLFGMTLNFVMPDPSAMVERLVAPDSIVLTVGDIAGSGTFTFSVSPASASQNIRATVTALTGNAYVAGNMIYATAAGTVRLRVASAVDSSVYAEATVNVYPASIIRFADGETLTDGIDYITEY